MDKICLNCAKHFTPIRPHHNYCYACWNEHMREVHRHNKPSPYSHGDTLADWLEYGIAPSLNADFWWDDDLERRAEYYRLCDRDRDNHEL